ncbi:hypothetical protein HPB51_016763 [Rhipicephalus microplus]|uniref:Uncharacterized protein n=1 Tax=Rhipicephalus microplus TaxID=6941 RepID=A0A9J6DAA3_RHIMP|nr:hypothetical protein HPB51_016763 [Rhipicephalus microplus]
MIETTLFAIEAGAIFHGSAHPAPDCAKLPASSLSPVVIAGYVDCCVYIFPTAYRKVCTFHTPSFGDEEFDIPPINLQNVGGPTHPDEAATAEVVYGSQPGMAPQTSMAQAMGSPMSGGMMEPPPHSYPGPQGPQDMYHHAMGMPPPSMHLQRWVFGPSAPSATSVLSRPACSGGWVRPLPAKVRTGTMSACSRNETRETESLPNEAARARR